MGFSHSTYHFYGVHIPEDAYEGHAWTEAERLDGVIAALGERATGVGHIEAGNYDRDRLFLCVVPDGVDSSVNLGSFAVVCPELDFETLTLWEIKMQTVIDARGYSHVGRFGFHVVPDMS